MMSDLTDRFIDILSVHKEQRAIVEWVGGLVVRYTRWSAVMLCVLGEAH